MLVVGASLGGAREPVLQPVRLLRRRPWSAWPSRRCWCFGCAGRCRQPRDRRRRRPGRCGRSRRRCGYIRHHPRVLSLVTVKSAVGLGNGVLAVFPVLAAVVVRPRSDRRRVCSSPPAALGALIGPLLFRRVLGHRRWLMPGLAVSMVAYGVAYLGVAVSPWFWLVLVLVVVGAHRRRRQLDDLELRPADRGARRAARAGVRHRHDDRDAGDLGQRCCFAGVLVDHVDPRVPIAICGGLTLVYGDRAGGWRPDGSCAPTPDDRSAAACRYAAT